jgi:DNA repair photolyase
VGRVHYVELRCKSALNRVQGMPFRWSLNPYAGCRHSCVFCFAREFYVRADRGDGAADFETRILVKVNFAEVLREQLGRPSWKREPVALGTATDPYQPAEGRYRLTRRVLEALHEYKTPVSMLTKSPLVLRDLDILAALARVVDVRVCFSITTVDIALWRTVERSTANPFHRLRVMRLLTQAGVPAGVAMAPILPGITDSEASIEAVAGAAAEHKAAFFWAASLRLMPVVKAHYLGFVAEAFPDLLRRYEQAYPGAYAPRDYQRKLEERVERIRTRYGFGAHLAPQHPPQPIGAHGAATASGHRDQLALPL